MTLIALKMIDKIPVLFGDLLLTTSNIKQKIENKLPGSRSFNGVSGNYYIASLKQKVFIIDESIAISWAGNLNLAIDLHNKLQDFIQYNSTYTEGEIQDFLESFENYLIKKGEETNLSFIMIYNKETTTISEYNCTVLRNKIGKVDIIVAGSGYQDFIDLNSKFLEIEGQYQGRESFLNKCLYFQGSLWSKDTTDAQNIHNLLYGGGYEACYLSEDGFTKLDDVILHNTIGDRRNGLLKRQGKLVKMDYWNDILVIRVDDYNTTLELPKTNDVNTYIISPINIRFNKKELYKLLKSLPDKNAKHTCVNVIIIESDTDISHNMYASTTPDRLGVIRHEGNTIRFTSAYNKIVQGLYNSIKVKLSDDDWL